MIELACGHQVPDDACTAVTVVDGRRVAVCVGCADTPPDTEDSGEPQ